jgi:hypothetical protein
MSAHAKRDPISPELVLVSSPDAADLARKNLPAPEWWLSSFEDEVGRIELAAAWAFCLAVTIGPMLFLLALRA